MADVSLVLDSHSLLLATLMLVMALLYSSVGHGGASGYLAAMALLGVAPFVMKPTALALNVCVALIAVTKFYRAGAFSWKLFVPLALSAVPMAYFGGKLTLPVHFYNPLVGLVLLYAAARTFVTARNASVYDVKASSWAILLPTGAALGLLSGLTGVGGGIFLSPLLLFLRWAPVKVISGVSAAFILVNSIAGILGVMSTQVVFHPALPLWAAVVMVGGYIGAEYGSKRFGNPTIQKLLAVVLVIAGGKMFFQA